MIPDTKPQPSHHRYFVRESYRTRLRYTCPELEGSVQEEGMLGNKGDGGVYFEAGQYLKPGTRLHLLIDEPASGSEKGESQLPTFFLATVRWCNELQTPVQSAYLYGVGAHFVSNECEWCGEIVPYEQIHSADSSMILCDVCLRDLEDLNSGRLKHSLTNHLLGNVI